MKNKRREVTEKDPFTCPRRNGISRMLLRDSSKNEFPRADCRPDL